MKRKGIILSGGLGKRLYPVTQIISKQLLPVYDKPMIYYPLSTLMLMKIREFLIITTPYDKERFIDLLGNGSKFGISIEYIVQNQPKGIAEAMIIAENFLNHSPSVLILGDNIFYGHYLPILLNKANKKKKGATIFVHHVNNPEGYGVVDFGRDNKIKSIEEKPVNPKSNYVITGLYFYDKYASEYAKKIKPSSRGELEITDLNKIYLKKNQLSLEIMGRGYSWFDTGTHDSLIEANQFIMTIEKRQGLKISCPEEISLINKWINKNDLKKICKKLPLNNYSKYLNGLL